MIRRSDRLILQRLLLAGWDAGTSGARIAEAFTVPGIGRGLPLSERSQRESLRRLVRLRLARVTEWERVEVETPAGPALSRKPRKVYRLTPEGYDVALGRTDRPVVVPFDFATEFPVPAVTVRDFLVDPRRTGSREPSVVRVRDHPPEYLVSVRGVRVFYRVADVSPDRIVFELSLGFDVPGAEPLWGRASLRLQEGRRGSSCVVGADRVETSANGVVVFDLLIRVASNLAADLFLRDLQAALASVGP